MAEVLPLGRSTEIPRQLLRRSKSRPATEMNVFPRDGHAHSSLKTNRIEAPLEGCVATVKEGGPGLISAFRNTDRRVGGG